MHTTTRVCIIGAYGIHYIIIYYTKDSKIIYYNTTAWIRALMDNKHTTRNMHNFIWHMHTIQSMLSYINTYIIM